MPPRKRKQTSSSKSKKSKRVKSAVEDTSADVNATVTVDTVPQEVDTVVNLSKEDKDDKYRKVNAKSFLSFFALHDMNSKCEDSDEKHGALQVEVMNLARELRSSYDYSVTGSPEYSFEPLYKLYKKRKSQMLEHVLPHIPMEPLDAVFEELSVSWNGSEVELKDVKSAIKNKKYTLPKTLFIRLSVQQKAVLMDMFLRDVWRTKYIKFNITDDAYNLLLSWLTESL